MMFVLFSSNIAGATIRAVTVEFIPGYSWDSCNSFGFLLCVLPTYVFLFVLFDRKKKKIVVIILHRELNIEKY